MKQGLNDEDVRRIVKRLDKIEESIRAIREFLENKVYSAKRSREDLNSVPRVAGYPIVMGKDPEYPFVAGNKRIRVKRVGVKGNHRTRTYRISMVTEQLNSKK